MSPTLSLSSQQRRTLQCQGRSDPRFFASRCVAEVVPDIDAQALVTALRALVERHDLLRAGADEAWRDAATGHDAEGSRGMPLDLGSGARLQAFLSESAQGRRLELRLPATAGDRQTLRNLVAESNTLLRDGVAGLPEVAPYALVVQWQQDLLHDPEAQVGIAFWRTRLANPPAAPRLLLERAGDGLGFSPDRMSFPLDDATVAALRTLAERTGTGAQAVLIALWKTLLARMTDAPELVVGVVSAGRTDESLENVIGPLARVLPLRLPYYGDIPLRSAIEEAERHLFDADAWQDCFSGEEGPAGQEDASFPAFIFEMLEPVAQTGPLRIVEESACAQSFRLRLGWRPDGMELDYDASRLSPAQAERIGASFLALLRRACEDPETLAGAVDIVDERDRRRLLDTVCIGPAVGDDSPPAVHAAFLEVVRRTPQRVAIATIDGAISYAELERSSRRIASRLRREDIGAEDRIAILADGSPGMIAAVLGILRAGAAFLPIDRLAPPQRQRALIADARPSALYAPTPAVRALLAPLAADTGVPLIDGAVDDASADAPPPHPDQIAYVLYTSGSTGEPKGIAVPHRALSNHMAWIVSALDLGPDDRILQRTPLGFDASIWEVFAPLMTGGTLVQCAEDANFDVDGLIDTIVRNDVTVLQTVPALLQALLVAGLARARSLRALCCGGDALPARLREEAARATGCRPVNLYGPTETCIDASWWQGEAAQDATVPIGRPIAGDELFVVASGTLAATGVRGEIFIGGAGLARGYLHQPRWTATAFVPHPWSPRPGARLYRTGDHAYWDDDGLACFLGRQDDQIKVRGVRVQLEEIRASLLRHPAVRECLVLPGGEDGPSRQTLLAFVELRADQDPDRDHAAEWQRHVRAHLSDAMVPTNFVILPEMPRTASGKPDRDALAGMRIAPSRNQPTTPTEHAVAGIWKELLNLDEIDTEQNFFALGGHSLLLTKLVARVAEELDVQVPLRGLFDAPTLSGFSAMIDALKRQHPSTVLAEEGVAPESSPT
ncbi:MAG: non-ribosomal peptide synthetase [Pseudomonadota bacterium]